MTFYMPAEEIFANVSVFLLYAWFCASVLEIRKPLLSIGLGTFFYGWLLPVLSIQPVWVDNVPAVVRYIVTMLVFWLFTRLAFRGRLMEKLVAYFIGYSMITISQVLATVLIRLAGLSPERDMEWLLAVSVVLGFVLMYLISKIWKSIALVTSQKRFWTFLLIPACQFAIIALAVFFMSKSGNENLFVQASENRWVGAAMGAVFVLSLVADALVMNSIVRMESSIKEKERLKTLELENQLNYEYVKAMESDIDEMRKYRHDFLNMLTAVQLTIENGGENRDEEALNLIRQMTKELGGITGKHYCECNIVNCILAFAEKKMTEAGIESDFRAEIPEPLGVSELDLCRVMTNLFDNAWEHCQRLPETERRWVKANLGLRDGFLYIVMSNSSKGEFSPRSSKRDRKNHGHGLDIIREIAQKHDGELIISGGEGAVEVTVALRWKQ